MNITKAIKNLKVFDTKIRLWKNKNKCYLKVLERWLTWRSKRVVHCSNIKVIVLQKKAVLDGKCFAREANTIQEKICFFIEDISTAGVIVYTSFTFDLTLQNVVTPKWKKQQSCEKLDELSKVRGKKEKNVVFWFKHC